MESSSIRHEVNQVFTPRMTSVNKSIYVERPELEIELKRALAGTLHVLVYGESGSGKSWLCKKVLADLDTHYVTANCANASRLNSLTQEIHDTAIPSGTATQNGYSEGKEGELGIFEILKSTLLHSKSFDMKKDEPLLAAFKKIREKAKNRPAVIVIDNLEAIFNRPEIMAELADIIILLDDSRYDQYKIKLLIIGVPSGVIEYFSKTKNATTIANRVQEISEVANLSANQVHNLAHKGFMDLLKSDISSDVFEVWQNHIYLVTIGIAQRVHEYCLQLAHCLQENNWVGESEQLNKADTAWLKMGLKQSFQVIDSLMNERDTKTSRRNQVLFALSKVNSRTFTPTQIEDIVRSEFPNSTYGVTLGIGQIMAADLSGKDIPELYYDNEPDENMFDGNNLGEKKPIIKRTSTKGTSYEFVDPRYLMCLRVALKKENEKVIKCDV